MSSPRNRFYGFALLGVSFLWGLAFLVFAWSMERRFNRRVDDLRSVLFARVDTTVSNSVSASFADLVLPPLDSAISSMSASSSAPSSALPYRVLGTGQNDKYFYLDVRHANGEVCRYFISKYGGKDEALQVMDRIEMDSADVLAGWSLRPQNFVLDRKPQIWFDSSSSQDM